MKDVIDQFMWGFQQSFRFEIQWVTEQALSQVGVPLEVEDVTAVLVGIAQDQGLRHQICVEPEDGLLTNYHLIGVIDNAAALYRADPESNVFHTDQRIHDMRQKRTFLQSRGSAIVESIGASGMFKGLSFFVSSSAPIGGYEVHSCIGIPSKALDSLPAFEESVVNRVYTGRSLQHEVIAECLRRADKALYLPDPGAGLLTLGSPEEIINAAAEQFSKGATWRTAGMTTDLFSTVNAFASLTYERAGAGGHLVITSKQNVDRGLKVRFQRPVRLSDARSMRKLLELSDSSMLVLSDYQYAYGLGSICSAPDVVEITITGHAKWELSVNGESFLRVSYGNATLPRPPFDFERLKDVAERTVGSVDLNRIWEIIEQAQVSGHGTTIVVSNDPEGEADRLGREAVPIVADHLGATETVRLGLVDGALLLGPDGRCHAFAVILDGNATALGDRARGSRFNSAVRYQSTTEIGSFLVVISDDGSVDLIPQLKPRVYRDEVEAAVQAFCACAGSVPVDGEAFAKTYNRVRSLAFYLDGDQCLRVNESHDKEMCRRLEAGGIAMLDRILDTDPMMKESYFWDPS